MTFLELRKKHPRLVYQTFHKEIHGSQLRVRFDFLLEPDIVFHPTVILPVGEVGDSAAFDNLLFHLGLMELPSYWKAACPPQILITAGYLDKKQIAWWRDLFVHGLGEFFYQNKIDGTAPDLLQIKSDSDKKFVTRSDEFPKASGDLILVGGGKDSTVTLELLKGLRGRRSCLVLNPIAAAQRAVEIAGYGEPLVVERTIDPTLLQLNERGYLNGHTPFSAYLAFLGMTVAVMHGFQNVIVANDRSADEGSVVFHGLEINHQYSKTYRFEKLFRDYCARYLNPAIQYFSFLRPLYEIQISRLFADCPQHFSSFRSCNAGQKADSWCGKCAKCAFVYISLFPFLPLEKMKEIFGEDYYFKPEIAAWVRRLVGLEEIKPLDCVGTKEESILAVGLAIRQYRAAGTVLPPVLAELGRQLGLSNRVVKSLEKKISLGWQDKNFLPQPYARLLRAKVSEI